MGRRLRFTTVVRILIAFILFYYFEYIYFYPLASCKLVEKQEIGDYTFVGKFHVLEKDIFEEAIISFDTPIGTVFQCCKVAGVFIPKCQTILHQHLLVCAIVFVINFVKTCF